MSGPISGGTIEIAICLDEALLLPAAVLLRSIAEHARPARPVRVHALAAFDAAKLHALAPASDAAFSLVATTIENRYADLPRNAYISQGTYLRFLLPERLADVRKLIYLDVDMVVHRDLAALFDVDIDGVGLGATTDTTMLLGSRRWEQFDLVYDGRDWTFADYVRDVVELQDGRGDEYFNAGLLLIDLDHWRRRDIARRTIDFIARKPRLQFMDQDALSHVMQGEYRRLDPRWNAMASCATKADRRWRTMLSREGRRWERARGTWRDEPWIVHFAGPHKPWNAKRPVPHADLWWGYARRSRAWPALAAAHAGYQAACRAAEERERSILSRMTQRLVARSASR